MNTTEKERLLLYLKDAIDQETAVLQQQEIIKVYDKQSEIRKPTLIITEDPQPPVKKKKAMPGSNYEADSQEFSAFTLYISIFGTCSLIGLILVLAGLGGAIPLAIGIVGLLPYLIMVINRKRTNKKYNTAYEQECAEYAAEKHRIYLENEKSKRQYERDMHQWKETNNEMHVNMEKTLAETKNLLVKFYNLNTIYPKYCTLPALTSIYEYFMTGRCEELTGPHGAYNLYEDELRKDTIINRLDTVIENLEQIKQNQYMLYQQIKEVQENTNRIVSELQQIKGYTINIAQLTALNAYYAARTERNTRITMYYNL